MRAAGLRSRVLYLSADFDTAETRDNPAVLQPRYFQTAPLLR